LTSLPKLNENLEILSCSSNSNDMNIIKQRLKIFYLPSLKRLTSLPKLNENLEILSCSSNSNDMNIIKQRLKILNNFCHLYYCLKFKKQFRHWLWVRVREPKIRKKYHYDYLLENLRNEEANLDKVLDDW
jgi:hypothetical protein